MTQLQTINIKPAKTGALTALATLTDGTAHHLHSAYDPESEARDWLAQFELLPNTAYVVLGFGLGYHVRALLDKLPENSVIIVLEQDSTQCLAESLPRQFPREFGWRLDQRIYSIAQPARTAAGMAQSLLNRHSLKRVTLCRHYPSMAIQPDYFQTVEDVFMEKVREYFRVGHNFSTSGILLRMDNIWHNLPYIYKNPGIADWLNRFSGKPAIIVAAGPSLNKNIDLLKKLTGKALIIAAGTALGALYKHGITPHVLAVLDPTPKMYEGVKNFLQPETTLLLSPLVHEAIPRSHSGRIMFYKPTNDDVPEEFWPVLPPTALIPANFSVATAAYGFACFAGANPIICVGQDLAYTAESHHADGVIATDMSKATPKENIAFVPGYYGGMVQTDLMFKDIIDYITSIFEKFSDRTFINATEGGAYIPGAVHMPLADAAAQYLTEEWDIPSVIRELTQPPDQTDKPEFLDKLAKISQLVDERRDCLKAFLTEVDAVISGLSDDQTEEVRRLTRRMQDHLDVVIDSGAYPYCRQFIDPVLKMLDYELQDKPSPVRTCKLYQVVLNNMDIVFTELSQHVSAASAEIAGGGVPVKKGGDDDGEC